MEVTITDNTNQGDTKQSTPEDAKQGALAELAKVENQVRSVGGDKTSPTLSGGKSAAAKAAAPGQKVAAEKKSANTEKQAAKKTEQAAKKAGKTK